MNESMKWLPEILVGAALLASVYFLVAPRPRSGAILPLPEAPAAEQPAEVEPQPPASERRPASPGQIAALFGWEEPATALRTPPAPSKPVEAIWLKPVGFVIGEGGGTSYVFKDTKSNSVLTLVPKVENKGWVLQEVREREFELEFKGTKYIVRRNE
jgi:hypothetical protein